MARLLPLPTPEVWKTSLPASEPAWVWHKAILWCGESLHTAAFRPSFPWQWEQQSLLSEVLTWLPGFLSPPFPVVGRSPETEKFMFFYIAEKHWATSGSVSHFLMTSKWLVKKSLLLQKAYVFNPKDGLAPMQGKPPGAKAQ